MSIVGAGTRIYVNINSTYHYLNGASGIEQADPGAGAGATVEGFIEDFTSPGTPTVGAFSVTCELFTGDPMFQYLSSREGQNVDVYVVTGRPRVKHRSKANEGVAIAANGNLTFSGNTSTGVIASANRFTNQVEVGDMLVVNKTVGVSTAIAENAAASDLEVYGIKSIGTSESGNEDSDFDKDASVYPFTPTGTAISAKGASVYVIMSPYLSANFSAPVTGASGFSVSGKTTPATRTISFQPSARVAFNYVVQASNKRFIPAA